VKLDDKKEITRGDSLSRTHLLDYWRVIRRRRYIVFACAFISVVTAFIAGSFKKPLYQSAATILIDESRKTFTLPAQSLTYEDYYQKQRAFETHFKIIKSYPLIQMVISQLDLRNHKWDKTWSSDNIFLPLYQKLKSKLTQVSGWLKRIFQVEGWGNETRRKTPLVPGDNIPRVDPLVFALQSAIEVIPVPETNLVKIKVQHEDPWMTVNVANGLARAYQDYVVQQQMDTVKENLRYMTQEICKLRDTIEESEQKLHRYREQSNMLEANQENSLQAGELAHLRRDSNLLKAQRIEVEAQLSELRKLINKGANYIPAFAKSELLENIASQLVNARLELEKLLKRYKKKHPKVINIQTNIDMLEQQFLTEIKKAFDSKYTEYQVLLKKEKLFDESLAQYTEKVIQSDRFEIEYGLLEHEASANQELYNVMMRQLKSVNISEGIQNRTISIIEQATFPENPIYVNKTLNILLSLVLGLVLGICLALFLDYLDCTIKGVEDVKESLGLPVLGIIPSFDKG
jgi:succinoglycan biosynthesis transport protein ExoP